MRQFSSAVQTVLNSDVIKFAFLIKLEFNTTHHFTSYHRDLVYNGATYIADGGVFEFEPPKFSSVVDREAYRVVIADLINQMVSEFKLNVVGKIIDVKLALLDANGDPLLGTSDVLSVYRGFVDKPSIENSMENKLAVIEGTSPMADLDAVNTFITSKDGMDQKSSTDTSFDEIFENKEITIKWGKV